LFSTAAFCKESEYFESVAVLLHLKRQRKFWSAYRASLQLRIREGLVSSLCAHT